MMIGLDLQPYLLMNHLFSFKLILFVSGQNAGNQSTNAKKSQNTKQRKKIMFWGAFNSILKLPLYFVEGRMNSKKYCEILNTNLLPHVSNAFNYFRILQDNDPKHNSEYTMEWMEEKGVSVLSIPKYSPDLNPIDKFVEVVKV